MDRQEIFIKTMEQVNRKAEKLASYLLREGIYPMEEDGTYSALSCRYAPDCGELVFHHGGQGIRAVYGIDGSLKDLKYNPKVYMGRQGPGYMTVDRLYHEGYEVKEELKPLMGFLDGSFKKKEAYYGMLRYEKEGLSVYFDEKDKLIYIGTGKEKAIFSHDLSMPVIYMDVGRKYEETTYGIGRLKQLVDDRRLMKAIEEIIKNQDKKGQESYETGIQGQDRCSIKEEAR